MRSLRAPTQGPVLAVGEHGNNGQSPPTYLFELRAHQTRTRTHFSLTHTLVDSLPGQSQKHPLPPPHDKQSRAGPNPEPSSFSGGSCHTPIPAHPERLRALGRALGGLGKGNNVTRKNILKSGQRRRRQRLIQEQEMSVCVESLNCVKPNQC